MTLPRQPRHFLNNIQNEIFQVWLQIILDRTTFHTANDLNDPKDSDYKPIL